MPSAPQLAILVQTAVVALSQANLTSNYTVLHALAAPDFQKNNPPEKLAQVFAEVRKIDLTPVILYSPQLSRPPVIDDKNMLRLTGFYKTSPQQVLFDILYQPVEGHWRLYGISVGTQPAQARQPQRHRVPRQLCRTRASLRPPTRRKRRRPRNSGSRPAEARI